MDERTHASFFSGVGGLDLGLERAGWRTVSFSEIDPYASAVLAERWPGVPNLGDITAVAEAERRDGERYERLDGHRAAADGGHDGSRIPAATLWTGGFPCQDLSVAGKRRGMVEGTRSNLAYAFLALVERHRPPAILLENVPGLLSSHGGRDMAALLGAMVELGYGVAYRVLDARHFGVPQRRRRVFILGLRSDPDDPSGRAASERAAAVLAVGSRCDRHPPAGVEAGPGVAAGAPDGAVGTFTAGAHPGSYNGQDAYTGHLVSSEAHARRDGASHGLAGRLDDRRELASAISASQGHHGHSSPRGDGSDNLVAGPILAGGSGGQRTTDLNTPLLAVPREPTSVADGIDPEMIDPLLPLGLDSHRYRCCGNGVVAPVSQWIGTQLLEAIR